MPTQTIPLVGTINSRLQGTGFTKDQVFKGCFPRVLKNPAVGNVTAYLQKRAGIRIDATLAAGNAGTALGVSPSTANAITAFGTTSTIYIGSTSVGTLTTSTYARHISETIISGVTYHLISSTGAANEGWYLASDSFTTTAYTADGNNSTTITDLKVLGVNSVAGLYVGQKLTAASNIVAGSRIVSINAGAFSAVLDTATTGGAFSDLAITKEPIARIIDADFPTNTVGEFIELSGFVFIATSDGKIYNSDINSIASWTATSFISSNLYTDGGSGLAKDGDKIIAFGSTSGEWFYNAGNATGSPLSKTGRSMNIGASVAANAPLTSNISSSGIEVCWAVKSGLSKQIWMLSGGNPQKISNSFVEQLLTDLNIVCIASFAMMGERFIFVSTNTPDYNLMYSIDTGLWTDANAFDGMIVSALRDSSVSSSSMIYAIESASTTGVLYKLTAETFADKAAAFSMVVQTTGLDFGTDERKFVSAIWLDADTSVSADTTTLEYSDDDFVSFTTHPQTFDMTAHEKKITRVGSHKSERAYRLTNSSTLNQRWRALRIQYEVGR